MNHNENASKYDFGYIGFENQSTKNLNILKDGLLVEGDLADVLGDAYIESHLR
jgi:hypothetical protein